jgi:hypothetical protein
VHEEVLWTSGPPCVCLVPNGPSIPPNTKKYSRDPWSAQGDGKGFCIASK